MEPRGNAAGLMPLCLSLPLVFSGGRKALAGRVSVRAATPGGNSRPARVAAHGNRPEPTP